MRNFQRFFTLGLLCGPLIVGVAAADSVSNARPVGLTSRTTTSTIKTDYSAVADNIRYNGLIEDWDFVNADLNAGGRSAFDDYLTGKFCMTTTGNRVTVSDVSVTINCGTAKPANMRPDNLMVEYNYALCRGKCANGGGTYRSGSGIGDGCVCSGIEVSEPTPEYDAEKLERLNAQVARQTDKSINKYAKRLERESDKELQKQVKADSRQLDKDIQAQFDDIDADMDELTDELNRQKFEADMQQAATDDTISYADEMIAESDKELQKQLKDEERQFKKDMKAELKESDADMDELTDELNRQKFEADMQQAAIDDAANSFDELNAESDKELKKQLECESKDPPKAAKKNKLGLWVCVDTDETKKAREEKKKNNKTLKAFWDEMDDLESAFNKRVRQLQREAKKSQRAKK